MSPALAFDWREIPDCPGYTATMDGRILSFWVRRAFGPPSIDWSAEPIQLRAFDRRTMSGRKSGYLSVNLTRNGRRCNRYVHDLVLSAWVGLRPGSPDEIEACHENGVRHDNRVCNLRWDTVAANAADRVRHALASEPEPAHCFADLLEVGS